MTGLAEGDRAAAAAIRLAVELYARPVPTVYYAELADVARAADVDPAHAGDAVAWMLARDYLQPYGAAGLALTIAGREWAESVVGRWHADWEYYWRPDGDDRDIVWTRGDVPRRRPRP